MNDKDNKSDNPVIATSLRDLHDLNFFELKTIASRVTGKKATMPNIIGEGAKKLTQEFNLKSDLIAVAANLVMAAKGQHKMMCNINKAIGDEVMKTLTVATPAIELFKLMPKGNVEQLALFLSDMARRQSELTKLEAE